MDDEAFVMVMCTESDFEKWKNGELIFDYDNEKLVPYTDEIRELKEEEGVMEYVTYEDFQDWSYMPLYTFERTFTTPSGEKVVAFGYYGYQDLG